MGSVDSLQHSYTSSIADNSAPVTVADYIQSGWNTQNPLIIHLSATDDVSGVAQTYYKVAGSDQQAGNTISITAEGESVVEYWSVDNKGNSESVKTLVVQSDFTKPKSSHDYTGSGTEENSVTLNFVAVDNLSGIDRSVLLVNGVENVFGQITLLNPGIYLIEYFSIDGAGNTEDTNTLELTIIESGTPIENLKANQVRQNDVMLHWKGLENAVEYIIYRSVEGAEDNFIEIGRTQRHKYTDIDLEIGKWYYYMVKAANSRSDIIRYTH